MRWIFFAFGSRLYRLPIDAISIQLTLGALSESTLVSFAKPIGIWKKFHDALVLSTYFVLFAPKSFTKFCWHVPSYAGFWLDIRCLAWYLLNGVSNGLLVDFPRAPEQIFDYKTSREGQSRVIMWNKHRGFVLFFALGDFVWTPPHGGSNGFLDFVFPLIRLFVV